MLLGIFEEKLRLLVHIVYGITKHIPNVAKLEIVAGPGNRPHPFNFKMILYILISKHLCDILKIVLKVSKIIL